MDQVGGGSVEGFATLYDPEPCHVTVSVGYPDRQNQISPEALQCPMFSVTDARQVFHLTDAAAAKVKSLIEAEDSAESLVLRVAVRPGGCSGLQLRDVLRHRRGRRRHQTSTAGSPVVIDPASLPAPRRARRSTTRTASRAPGSRSPTRTRSAPAAAASRSPDVLPARPSRRSRWSSSSIVVSTSSRVALLRETSAVTLRAAS